MTARKYVSLPARSPSSSIRQFPMKWNVIDHSEGNPARVVRVDQCREVPSSIDDCIAVVVGRVLVIRRADKRLVAAVDPAAITSHRVADLAFGEQDVQCLFGIHLSSLFLCSRRVPQLVLS
jgi:hypothetical protein